MRIDWHVRERIAYDTPWWRIFDDLVTRPDGTTGTYVWAKTTNGRGAVMTMPQMPDGRLLMIRIYRHPTRRYFWEFIAGLVDDGEQPEQTAMREVEEELGIKPLRVELFPAYTPVSGFVGDRFHIALATMPPLGLDDLSLQVDEGIMEARFVTLAETRVMVRDGRIDDGITLVALAHLWAKEAA